MRTHRTQVIIHLDEGSVVCDKWFIRMWSLYDRSRRRLSVNDNHIRHSKTWTPPPDERIHLATCVKDPQCAPVVYSFFRQQWWNFLGRSMFVANAKFIVYRMMRFFEFN